MKWTLLTGLCLFCLCLVLGIVIVLLSQVACPVGTFRCGNSSVCLPRRLKCDGRRDCSDASDEDPVQCTDFHGELDSVSDLLDVALSLTTRAPTTQQCAIELPFPAGCECSRQFWLSCRNLRLKTPPRVANLLRINLMENDIERLEADDFRSSPQLELIHLDHNRVDTIEDDTFHQLKNIRKIFLNGNRLVHLSDDTFLALDKLQWIFMKDNQLDHIDFNIFGHLSSIQWIDVSRNNLSIESGNVFPLLPSLKDLMLDHNCVERVENDTFAQLPALMMLDLGHNRISHIDENALTRLTDLRYLDLSHNNLEHIPRRLFQSQRNLSKLILGWNPIMYLSPDSFAPLISLQSISLQDIELVDISVDMFVKSTHLDFAYFKNFRYCSYVANASKCQPLSDGVSSFSDLISNDTHRVCLWVIGVATLLGNAFVLGGRHLAKTENRILASFVKNLAAADMCIGIYLLCIGERDQRFRGRYNQHAHEWMTSWPCICLRLLAVTTSEVSLLLLTFMSVERFISISQPFGERTLTFRAAIVSICLIWVTGFALALVPVLYWNEMGSHHGSNGLCFPLHIHEPKALGWQYSSFLYVAINGLCIAVMVGVYWSLFASIRRTRNATPLAANEIEIAVRFFFIVFTDVVCWSPAVVLKIAALGGLHVPAHLYAWFVVFILPVNSALNPALYTFTTPGFRTALGDFLRRRIGAGGVSCSAVVTSRCSQRNNNPAPLISDGDGIESVAMATR